MHLESGGYSDGKRGREKWRKEKIYWRQTADLKLLESERERGGREGPGERDREREREREGDVLQLCCRRSIKENASKYKNEVEGKENCHAYIMHNTGMKHVTVGLRSELG